MALDGAQQHMANYHQVVANVVDQEQTMDGPMFENFKALHAAIIDNDVQGVGAAAQTGISLDQKFDERVNAQHSGITPLALACALNKPPIVEAVLNNGANVNVPFAALNTTALMTSAFHGNTDVVRILLEHGADVSAVDLQQSTALGYAFGGSRNIDVIQLLLNAHIDVNLKNMLGMNALLLVAGYGNPQLVAMILRAGADANTSNDFGHTALHLAVVGKHDLIRNLRREKGADTSTERSLNRRNLDMAVQEWARLHLGDTKSSKEDQEALAAAGRIMMSIGHQLEDTPPEQGEDHDGLERRVRAVWKHRQMKLRQSREKRKSGGLWSLLSCGGGKSKHTDDIPTSNRPANAQPPQDRNMTPEEHQIHVNFTQILRMLIDVGCAIDRPDRAFGMTALDLAILNGDVESSAVLAGAGADPNHFLKMIALKEFYHAVTKTQTKEAKFLLDYDEDLDVNLPFTRFNVDDENDEGLTPLALTAREDNCEVARILLKRGAHPSDGGPAGRPPLTEAAIKGNRRMVELLLGSGANKESPSPAFRGATPITVAVIMRQIEIVILLIKRGAYVDAPQLDGRVALVHAFNSGDQALVEQILMAPLDTNFQDPQGVSATLATEYQRKDRDMEAILAAVASAAKEYEDLDGAPGQQLHHPNHHQQQQQPQQQQPMQHQQHVPQHQTPTRQQEETPPYHQEPAHQQEMMPEDAEEEEVQPQRMVREHHAPPPRHQSPPPQQQAPSPRQQAPPPQQQQHETAPSRPAPSPPDQQRSPPRPVRPAPHQAPPRPPAQPPPQEEMVIVTRSQAPVESHPPTTRVVSSPRSSQLAPSSPGSRPTSTHATSPTQDISQVIIKTQTITISGDGEPQTTETVVSQVNPDIAPQGRAPIVQLDEDDDDDDDEEEEESGSEEEDSEEESEEEESEEEDDEDGEEVSEHADGTQTIVTKTITTSDGVEGTEVIQTTRTIRTETVQIGIPQYQQGQSPEVIQTIQDPELIQRIMQDPSLAQRLSQDPSIVQTRVIQEPTVIHTRTIQEPSIIQTTKTMRTVEVNGTPQVVQTTHSVEKPVNEDSTETSV